MASGDVGAGRRNLMWECSVVGGEVRIVWIGSLTRIANIYCVHTLVHVKKVLLIQVRELLRVQGKEMN